MRMKESEKLIRIMRKIEVVREDMLDMMEGECDAAVVGILIRINIDLGRLASQYRERAIAACKAEGRQAIWPF